MTSQAETFAVTLRAAEKHLSRRDPVLREMIRKYGVCDLKRRTRYFEILTGSIISQQLSVKAAATIQQRLREIYSPPRMPEAAQLLETSENQLRTAGISRQKISYMRDLATKTTNGQVRLSRLSKMTEEEIIENLTQVKGIGVWTVHMFLIFSLGRLNVLPVGDLGIRKAVGQAYGLARLAEAAEVEKIASQNKWHPYCSVASWFLWRSLENKK
jgi:DNA-3-methyladenine glycosylase II